MKTLKQFIRENRVRMDVAYANDNPNMHADAEWSVSATHYRCILKVGRRRMTVPFSQGSAITREPTAEDVLDCLASDASGIENEQFEDWCANYGYDPDSRKAERTFNICTKQATQLANLLGGRPYHELLYETERL
jgi:hypothetical protein